MARAATPRRTRALWLSFLLACQLMLAGEFVSVARGLAAGQPGLPFCLGGVTLTLPDGGGATVMACPDGILALSALPPPPAPPLRPPGASPVAAVALPAAPPAPPHAVAGFAARAPPVPV
ncbi:hypothetical protein [Wenxinia marina]|uniref:Uncharacterized protein n=1 Tax=Wenxinia marina DSM 24838 TaxID=1123501 RepID=A0A0D0NPG6_9RHOB|nr:hypothetical protein [Wenxinia marina]KIQ70160.1 hypothetical protein Wenmar_01117 [Wenxinia marina DSM 24838]GGL50971.1 hypothetical protein GCM10011392_01390 [Wenxinia marina]